MFKLLKSVLKNQEDFPGLVWKKEDVSDWEKLKRDPAKKALLRMWYLDVYTTTIFPPEVNNKLTEEEIPAEIEQVLMSYTPPKIRNLKKILSIGLVLGIIAAIGIYYAVTLA